MKFIAAVMYNKSVTLQITWLIACIEWTAVCLISITSASQGVKVEDWRSPRGWREKKKRRAGGVGGEGVRYEERMGFEETG